MTRPTPQPKKQQVAVNIQHHLKVEAALLARAAAQSKLPVVRGLPANFGDR
jgi:hypothetical protein